MTEHDSPDLPEEEPTPAWLRAALDVPAPTDDLARERHVRAALRVFDEIHPDTITAAPASVAPVRRNDGTGRRRVVSPRWLTAAALLIAVGVAGVWASNSSVGDSDSASDEAASIESSDGSSADQDRAASSLAGEQGDATAEAGAASPDDAASDRAARETADAAIDLGVFTDDAELRAAIAASPLQTSEQNPSFEARAPTSTVVATPPAGAVTIACPVPAAAPGTPITAFRATVDSVLVQAWLIGTGDAASIVVVDAATCTVRPG